MQNTTSMTKCLMLLASIFITPSNLYGAIFNNTAAITVNDGAAATPYSSNILVSGMTGTITNVTVKLNNVSHLYIHDMSVIVQAPNGKSLLLQSGVADGFAVSNITYTFSDAAASQLSSTNSFGSGTYKPTGYFWDIFPAPGPLTPPGTNTYNIPGPFNAGLPLSTLASCFNGLNANGTWKLWVADFSAGGDGGIISGGWTLSITTGSAPVNSTLNLKLYLEGYYNGAGLMKPVMQNEGIPAATSSMTDSITVELRNTSFPYAVVSSLKTILNTNGTAICMFPVTGAYYVAVRHRNSITTWSANAVTLSSTAVTYNFSNAANKAYGSNQINVGSGVFAFYTGDINSDENVDIGDLGILENEIELFASGYNPSDINGDGNIDILDVSPLNNNLTNFVVSMHP